MKKTVIILLCFVPFFTFAQVSEQEKMLEALKQSGYVRQSGNTIIFKVKKASDTAQIKMMYGSLFNEKKYTIGFDIDGKYFDKKNANPDVKIAEKKTSPPITEAIITKPLNTTPLATEEQLFLTGGYFLIKTARDYRYISFYEAARATDKRPALLSYVDNLNQNHFKFISQTGGFYKIQTHHGIYLECRNNNVVSAEANNTDNQLWQLTPTGNGLYKIISKNGKYLSATESVIKDSSSITCTVSISNIFNAQLWQLLRMTGDEVKMTGFRPTRDGFLFANTFNNTRFLPGGVEMAFGGRCAGMVYAALDYYFNSIPIPAGNQLPIEGSVLSTYIGARQENSTTSNLDRFTELNFNPGGSRTMEFFNWGLQGFNGGRLEQIRAQLDIRKPVSVLLFNPAGDLINYPHHCVAVIGYSLGRYRGDLAKYKEELKLYVYDPNFPNDIKIMFPNLADINKPRYAYINAKASDIKEWLTYFPNAGYSVQTPLSNSSITDCPGTIRRLTGQNQRGKNYSNQNFKCAVANRTDFNGSTIVQTDFENANLDSAIFYGANVRNSNFSKTALAFTNFYGADLKDTRFLLARANHAVFEGADMKLSQLNTSELLNCNFRGTDLHRSQMAGTNCTGSHFTRASLTNSNCVNAIFNNAELSQTNFQNANLEGATFRNAIFERTDFRNANLTNADFTGANTAGRLLLDGAILTGVVGLVR